MLTFHEYLNNKPVLKETKCPDSPDGKHSFTPDLEYDSSGRTINCEYCGELKPLNTRSKSS